jgi:hypothetical protein
MYTKLVEKNLNIHSTQKMQLGRHIRHKHATLAKAYTHIVRKKPNILTPREVYNLKH